MMNIWGEIPFMKLKILTLLMTLFSVIGYSQSNIGFEKINLSSWKVYYDNVNNPSSYTNVGTIPLTGYNTTSANLLNPNNGYLLTTTPPTGVVRVTSTNQKNDPYGFFPVVCSFNGSGKHSVKLGNDSISSTCQALSYNIHIPVNNDNYKLTYYYAIVIEDPGAGHQTWEKPFFAVNAFDSADVTQILSCTQFSTVDDGGILVKYFGLNWKRSPTLSQNGNYVYYTTWTPATVFIKNMGGKTLTLQFISSGCSPAFGGEIGSPGSHFGYAYVDIDTTFKNITNYRDTLKVCKNDTSVFFIPPPGYKGYYVYDSVTGKQLGIDTNHLSDMVVRINMHGANLPKFKSTIKVVLASILSSACNDTLYYYIDTFTTVSKPIVNSLIDSVNIGDTIHLYVNSCSGLKYYWTGPNGFITTLQNPIIPNATAQSYGLYTVKVTNSLNGCSSDTSSIFVYVKGAFFSLKGKVTSVLGKTINNVEVKNLIGSNLVNTDSVGNYLITTQPNSNLTLKLSKNNDINKTNGITTLDMALIQSHILGKNKLNFPYKLIAADVNGDGLVTTLDIVYLKRLILGLDTTFTKTSTGEKRLWAFVDSSYQFPDTTNPFPFKDSISYIGLSANKTNQSFIGVKLGDVNWDWNPALARMPSKVFVRPKKILLTE